MRVLLVNLGSGDTDFLDKGRVFSSIYRRPYLGISYLSSYLKQHGHDVDLIDRQVEPFTPSELTDRIAELRYGLVGFFAIYVNREEVIQYVQYMKSRLTTPVVIGGPDCFNDQAYLKAGVDYVAHGEGEQTLLQLVEHLEGNRSLSEVKGISMGRNGNYHCAGPQPLLEDLDSLPFPDRSHYPIKVWHDFMDFNMRKPFTTLITARGCPYRCDFCDSPAIWRRKVRVRSTDNVLEEVDEFVSRYGVRYMLFADDIFGISFAWHKEFCEKLARRRYDLHWMCLVHPLAYARHSEERIELMARAGCRTIHMGVQSSDEQVLLQSGRYAQELQHHKRIFETARRHGILTFSTFIHGLPGDTDDVFRRNREFARRISPHYVLFLPLKVFAGSDLEKKLDRGELALPSFTFKEIVRSCRRAELEFYLHPGRTARLIGYILRHNPKWFLTKAWYALYMMARTVWIGLLPAKHPKNRQSHTLEKDTAPNVGVLIPAQPTLHRPSTSSGRPLDKLRVSGIFPLVVSPSNHGLTGRTNGSTKGRVLLVNTPRLAGVHYVVLPPLGLGYLAEALRRREFDVEIMDPIRDGTGLREFSDFFKKQGDRYDVVGFEFFSSMRSAVREFARVVKEARPNVWTLAGGPHPSAEPAETLQENPYLDFAVTTDSEQVVPNLLDRVGSGSPGSLQDLPGLAYRQNGHVPVNAPNGFPDVNDIPSPAWDLMPPETYPLVPNGVFTRNRRIATIIATRGCPYPCTFCEVPIKSGRKLRRRDPENVVAEIEMLVKKHGVREIHFMDDALTLDRRYAQSLFEAIIRSGLKIDWAVPNGVRLDCLDKETLTLMERSGCYSFAAGIESGSQRILDLMKKRLTVEEVREQVALVKSTTNIRVTGFFIIGFPGETPDDMEATIRLACDLPLDRANFFNYIPFPGGPAYHELKAKGTLRPEHYDEHVIYSISYVSEGLTTRIVKKYLRKSNLRFYLRPRILWGLAKEIRTASQVSILASRVRAILA